MAKLVKRTADSAEDFTVQPEWPVFAPEEPINLQVHWQRYGKKPADVTVSVSGAGELTTSTEYRGERRTRKRKFKHSIVWSSGG